MSTSFELLADCSFQIWETPFDSTNDTFPCSIDRTAGPLSNDDHMYLINHDLNVDIVGAIVSDPGDANTTNGVPSYVLLLLVTSN